MTPAMALTGVDEVAREVITAYWQARRYATPLYRARADAKSRGEALPQLARIGATIFELGVNAAYARYRLTEREVEDPERAYREAERLLNDSRVRLRQLQSMVRDEWHRYCPGAGIYRSPASIEIHKPHHAFRMHRRYVPVVLGGVRRR